MSPPSHSGEATPRFFEQPKAVWATAFACVVGFMSIGLVDPILIAIAKGLDATPAQVSLLFTSYFAVTAVMMLVTGFVASRLGGRNTLLLGAALIVVFAGLAGTSTSIPELVGFRAGWGLGNAFFVVTALSVIVAASRGGTMAAILMYESALGLGISAGPLVGAALGNMSWRYPFYGTSTLMAIGFLSIFFLLGKTPPPAQKIALPTRCARSSMAACARSPPAPSSTITRSSRCWPSCRSCCRCRPIRSAASSSAGACFWRSSRWWSRRSCRTGSPGSGC